MDATQQFDVTRYKHWIDDHVRFSDLDPVGHVNNNAIGQYFENARAYFYYAITPTWPHGETVFVLARSAIDYRRELHMPAKLRVGTSVGRIGRTSLTLANVLFHDGEGIAWCESVSVLIDRTSRRPVEIDASLRALCKDYMI